MRNMKEVKAVVDKFQEGYNKRDISNVDEYVELFDESAVVIGTVADKKNGYEWCVGKEEIKDLLITDWKGWGDLDMDLKNADFNLVKDTAWVGICGTVSMTSTEKEEIEFFLDAVEKIKAQEKDSKKRLLELVREGSEVLYQVEEGGEYVWPVRITAVLVKRDDRWKFTQMHFSHPTTRHPDVRK